MNWRWRLLSSALSPTGRLLRAMDENERRSTSEVCARSAQEALAAAKSARSGCSFHAERFGGVGDTLTLENWSDLPILEKSDLQRWAIGERSAGRSRRGISFAKTTSGSTGEVVRVRKDLAAIEQELACLLRAYRWAGVRYGDRQGRLWGNPDAVGSGLWRRTKDALLNRIRLPVFNVSDDVLVSYYELLLRRRVEYIYGYASMLSRFAETLDGRRQDGRRLKLKSVISTSEVLSEQESERVSDYFGARVHNEYGCGEVGIIGFSCERGAMHVMADCVYVEILDPNLKPCEPGQVGEIVVTELKNRSQPLIRYRLGDRAAWSDAACACGRGLPQLRGVYGRSYDAVITSNGRVFHPESILYVMEWASRQGIDVQRFQAVVLEDGRLLIRYVSSRDWSPQVKTLINERMNEMLGGRVTMEWERVPELRREPSGKTRLVVNDRKAALRLN